MQCRLHLLVRMMFHWSTSGTRGTIQAGSPGGVEPRSSTAGAETRDDNSHPQWASGTRESVGLRRCTRTPMTRRIDGCAGGMSTSAAADQRHPVLRWWSTRHGASEDRAAHSHGKTASRGSSGYQMSRSERER